mgnify:CR=1 FL=1
MKNPTLEEYRVRIIERNIWVIKKNILFKIKKRKGKREK